MSAEALKLTLLRPVWSAESVLNSFPSGHVAAVAGLGAGLLIALPKGKRRLATMLVAVPVMLTGLATVVLQWHRPSDVLGSTFLAVAVGGVASFISERTGQHHVGVSVTS